MSLARRCLMVALLALGFANAAAPAHAALTVCNRTSYVLYTATGTAINLDVIGQGWTRVVPGGCAVAIASDLTAPAYYLYAKTSQAHSGPAQAWGGSARLCVKDTNYTTRDPLNAVECQTDDFFQLPFVHVDMHHLRSWTTTLSETPVLATLPQAQQAGLKRLLRDIGYRIGAIDGKPDGATTGALADVRKRLRLAPTASVGDLFDALETEALKTATPAGFAICNDTAKSVAAAIGQKLRGDWISHGWWKIAAGSCAKVVDTLQDVESVYVLVQKIGGPALVGGPNKFCVTDIQFDIQSRGRCAARGLNEMGFAEMRVNGLAGYAAHIGDNGLVKAAPRRK